MKKITFMLMIMLMSISSYAQVGFYGFSQSTSAYAEVSAAATALPLVKADTYISPAQPIGFSFVYDGISYTEFKMSSNGFISFNTVGTSALTTNTLSDANASSRPIIAPLWDDLDGADPTTAYAGYEVTGTAPNRVLTVEWRNWEWNYNSVTAVISFQVKLHETTNVIDFAYRQEATAVNNGSATIGIGSSTGSGSGSYLNLTSVATPAVSATTSSTTLNTKPQSNTVYTFTPPVPCTGTPDGGSVTPAAFVLCTGSLPGTITATINNFSGLAFQWEQSIDNFVTAVNALGGSGVTTLAYTPPAYDGIPKKYRLKVTCTASGLFAYSTVSSVDNPASPLTAASITAPTNLANTSVTINFTAGSGGRRYVVVNTTNSFTDPSNGTVGPVVLGTAYAGGEQIVYDGTGTSVTVTGLACNASFYVRVYEYLRCGTTPSFNYYYNVSTSATNPVMQSTAQPVALPILNSFEGFATDNLPTAAPGWRESAGANPVGSTSAWVGSVLLSLPTAKVNLFAASKIGEWIISPITSITEASELKFKAAITAYNSASPHAVGIAGTDDSVQVMVSSDCGVTWTPIYTFDSTNVELNEELKDYSFSLDSYIGSSIQIAFKASEGTVNDDPDYDFHIGAIVIRKAPSCPEPKSLKVSAITATTARVNFEAPAVSPALGYDYILTSTNALPADNATVSGTIAAGAVFKDLSSLAPATKYFVWIRSKCSGNDIGPWSGSVNFTTNCEGLPVFSENFDSYATGVNSLPACWRRLGNSLASYITTGGVAPGSPANRFYMSANGSGTNPTQAFAVMPPVNNLQAGTHRLKFKAYSTVADAYLEVGYFEDFTDIASFVVIESFLMPSAVAANATEFSLAPQALPAGVTSLAFRNGGISTGAAVVYIDDVIWEVTPTCADVVNIVVSDVTSSTAYVEWEQTGGETGWQVIYGPTTITDPNDPSIANNIVSSTNADVIVSLLTPQTNYKIWVRSKCGAANGAWIGPVTFTTKCAGLPVPYVLDFESVTVPAIPNCTSVFNAGTGNNWTTNSPAANGFTTKVLRYGYSTSAPANAWFFTQGVQLTANTSYTIYYKYGNNSTTFIEKFKIMYGDSPAVDGMTEEIFDHTEVTGAAAQNASHTFTPNETGIYYFGFNAYSALNQFNLYVDDIKIDVTPTCIEPTAVVSLDITNTGATIQWTESVTPPASGYEYAFSTTNTLPAVLDATNSGTVSAGANSATISGLTPSTLYYVWVRSVCSDTDKSIWTLSVSFKTQCNDVTVFSENFDSYTTTGAGILPNCWAKAGSPAASVNITTGGVAPGTAPNRLYMYASFTASTKAFAVLPNVSNLQADTHRLKFKAYATTAGKTLEVGYFDDPNDVESFVELQSYALPSTTAATATQFVTLPTGVTAGVKNLVFRNAPTAGTSAIYIDDVIWEVAPACPDISNVTVSNPDLNSVTVQWTAGANETAWEVIWAPFSINNPNDASIQANIQSIVSGATLILPSSATTYRLWVRSSCGAEKGAWSAGVTFSTTCEPTDAPYTQDFETIEVPSLPACTSIQNAGTGNNWATASNPGYGFTTKALRYTYHGENAANAWFYTRGINLTAGQTYTVSYKYGGTGTSFIEKLKVMYGTSPDVASMVNAVSDHPNIVNSTPLPGTASITPDVTGVYYFGFNAYSAPNRFYLIIDDIKIEQGLSNDDFLASDFKAYPNPVKDFLNFSSLKNISNIQVFNILGQQVITKDINANQSRVDMSNLAAGTYLVKVSVENVVKTIKVIKQ